MSRPEAGDAHGAGARLIQRGSWNAYDLLELSLQLNNTPMSAVGSKSSYGFPDEVARDLLMNCEH
jgi:hypothetical protein